MWKRGEETENKTDRQTEGRHRMSWNTERERERDNAQERVISFGSNWTQSNKDIH